MSQDLRKALEEWAYERDFNVNNSTPAQDLLKVLLPVIEAAEALESDDAWSVRIALQELRAKLEEK